jgi:hypothetical protein
VTDGVDAAKLRMQVTTTNAPRDRAAVDPARLELARCHDAVLRGGHPRDLHIASRGAFRAVSA